jgi:hypothetical protein
VIVFQTTAPIGRQKTSGFVQKTHESPQHPTIECVDKFKQIESFVAVASKGSLTATAHAAGVAPATVDGLVLSLFRRAQGIGISAMTVIPTEQSAKLSDLLAGRFDAVVGDGPRMRAALLAQGQVPEVMELAGQGARLGEEAQEFRRRHVLIERGAFRQVSERGLRRAAIRDDGFTIDQRIPRIGLQHPGDHPHRRGLARAIRPEEAQHGALFHSKRHAAHGVLVSVGFLERVDFQHVWRGASTSAPN